MRRPARCPRARPDRRSTLVLALAAFVTLALPARARAQVDSTVLMLRSETGEYLLQGESRDHGPNAGDYYALLLGTNDQQLVFGLHGERFADFWNFDLALWPGPVAAGTYVVPLSDYPFLVDDESGMFVSAPSSRSGSGTALVHIKQLVRGLPEENLASLWVRFEFHHAADTPALSGEFRFGIAPAVVVDAPLRHVTAAGQAVALGVRAASATGRPLELSVVDPPKGMSFPSAGPDSATFRWTPGIDDEGVHVIRFAAADDSGRVDTTWTVVHVRGERRLRIDSLEGEWIGGGATREYDAGGARFTARPTFDQSGPHQGVHVEVESLVGDPSFTIEFFAPAGESLRVGRYPIATNEFPQPPGTARIQVNSSGRGCSRYAGSFTIHELDWGSFGVERVRATFDQRCDGGPALFGEVRVDARAHVTWTAPFVVNGRHGETFGFVAEAFDRRGGPLALTAASLPDGAKFIDQGFGQGTFAWTPPLGAIGRHEVVLVAAGAGGATDTARVRLQIAGDGAFAYVSPAGDGIGGGVSRSYGFDDGEYSATHDGVFGLTARFKPDSVDTPWTIQVDAPGGLAPGFYTGAVEFGSGVSRLRILAPAMAGGCNDEPGRFEIKQLETEPGGDVRSLWIRFARRCDPTSPMFAGELRLDAYVQVWTVPPALATQEIGGTTLVNVQGWQRSGAPAALHVTGLPEGATFASPDSGYGQIAWTPREDQIGSHLVVLHAVGEGGVADSTMIELEVVGRSRWSYVSEAPEEPVGQGVSASYGPADAEFFPYHSFGSVALSAYTGTEPPGGTVTLLPPAGSTFEPGIYTAARFPLIGQTQAGLQVTIGDRSCTEVQGAIRIRSVRVVDDVVQELDADYQQTCGASPYALRGAILYRVPTTFRAEAPIDVVVEAGDSVQVGVTATGGSGPLSFEALDLPLGAEFGPAGPDGAQLRWLTASSSMGVHVVRFVAIAADGRRDTVDTRIRVLGETRFTVASAPGDPVGRGQTYEYRWRTARWDLEPDFEGGLHGLVAPRQFAPAWSVVFAPPFGGFLTPGVYENAVHPLFRFTKPLHPVLHVSRDDAPPCLELAGRFEVKHLAFANHQVEALWIRFEQRCHPDSAPLTGEIRYNLDRTVPALVSLVSSTATDRAVRVTWQLGAGVASDVAVERRAATDAEWREVGRAAPDGTGRVAFEDTDVEPGARYGYRLAIVAASGVVRAGEAWIDVPARAEFALDGARPNPTSSGVVAAFAIPRAGPVRIELLDVGGRRVARRDEPGLAAGRHALPLAAAGTLAPGVYVIRLGWDGRTAHRRVTVVE
jgi:hypothetical protein